MRMVRKLWIACVAESTKLLSGTMCAGEASRGEGGGLSKFKANNDNQNRAILSDPQIRSLRYQVL